MTPSLLRSIIAAIAMLLCGAPLHAQNWTAANLHPPGANSSVIYGTNSTQQVGLALINYELRAALWSGSADSFVNLHPTAATGSMAFDLAGNRQVGFATYYPSGDHAIIWSGSAGNLVDLHPTGHIQSSCSAISGNQQVGYVIQRGEATIFSGPLYAALWSGSAASFVNLHPAGATESACSDTSGTRQVGDAKIGGLLHAALWSGSPGSFIDLHPAGATESSCHAISGNQQAGYAKIGGLSRAALWSGSAASFVNLHPAGATESACNDTSGTRQVGHAKIGGQKHAAIWSGTADSFVDLHSFLPPGYRSSTANSIWVNGSTILVGGSATTSSTPSQERAILWRYTPPRSPTLSIDGSMRVQTISSRIAVKGRADDANDNLARVEVKFGKAKFKKAKGLAKWRFTVRLRHGKNNITARAVDTTGLRSRMAKIVVFRR